MFTPPELTKVHTFFGSPSELAHLHVGESFAARMEDEISSHQGQIEAENYLINTIASYQQVAATHDLPADAFAALLRQHKYSLDAVKTAMIEQHHIPEAAFTQPVDFTPVDTADYMRQRAMMIGAVLSSTPVLLRDPWHGKPVTSRYGFTNFEAEVGGVGFSAIATPRHKDIPFRFALMKHTHDGYTDHNPAMILSNEFCDAFEAYNKSCYGNLPAAQHPLIVALATNFKPAIHDRFHNWFLYDMEATSEIFKQWGNDINLANNKDKNPLLNNYEQIALCFHLYAYQTLFDKNPDLKDQMYQRLEYAVQEIAKFGDWMQQQHHPQAEAIKESTIYALLSNICFVLNPFEDRFQKLMAPYPDVKEKLLTIRDDGKGLGSTLERLHGYEDGVPSLKYGGAKEAVFEYILRYPLADEIRAQREQDRTSPSDWESGKPLLGIEEYTHLPPQLQHNAKKVPDPQVFAKINQALAALPDAMREQVTDRIEISDEGYFFFRLQRDEIDYTRFEAQSQQKKLLLVDIPVGQTLDFTNEKSLSLNDKVRKQHFHLVGGQDMLAINVRDHAAANVILDYARTDSGYDPQRALEKAKELAAHMGMKDVGDLYKIEKSVAQSPSLYNFTGTGYYSTALTKYLAKSPGPLVTQLHSGGEQRLVHGACVYLPFGKNPQTDSDPDCHFIENSDFKRDYNKSDGTKDLAILSLRSDTPLMQHDHAQEALNGLLQTLHHCNLQVTHGASRAASMAKSESIFV